jgi:hypothetical protein
VLFRGGRWREGRDDFDGFARFSYMAFISASCSQNQGIL